MSAINYYQLMKTVGAASLNVSYNMESLVWIRYLYFYLTKYLLLGLTLIWWSQLFRACFDDSSLTTTPGNFSWQLFWRLAAAV